MLDKARDIEADEIVFDEKIKRSKKQIIKLSSKLDVEDALGDLIICLINSNEYLDGKVKIDYGKIESEVSEKKKVLIEDIFRYRASKVDDFRNKLLLALIEILDYEVKDYPQGLEKSIEVGRSTAGKCFFIDSFVTPLALSQELALVLQSKDAFGVVPKVFKNN